MAHGIDTDLNIKAIYDGKGTRDAERDLRALGKTSGTAGDALGGVTDKGKKAATAFDQLGKSIDKTSLNKRKFIGLANTLQGGMGSLTSSLAGVAAGFGGIGLGVGVAISAIGGYLDNMAKMQEQAKKTATELIANSDAAKQAGMGYMVAAQQLDELIKKTQEAGRGALLLQKGGQAGLAQTAQLISNETAAMLENAMRAAGMSAQDIATKMQLLRPELDSVGKASQNLAVAEEKVLQAQNAVILTQQDAVRQQIDVAAAKEALKLADMQYTDEVNKLSKLVGFDVSGAMQILTKTTLTELVPALKGYAKFIIEQGQKSQSGSWINLNGEEVWVPKTKPGDIDLTTGEWQPPGTAGIGGEGTAGQPKMINDYTQEIQERQIAEYEGTRYGAAEYGLLRRQGVPVPAPKELERGAQRYGKKKEQKELWDSYTEGLQQSVGNAVGEGIAIGFDKGATRQDKAKAIANMLISVIFTTLSAIPGIGPILSGLFGGMSGISLAGGGYLSGGKWRSFAGGGDYGKWVGSPTMVLGAKNNAIIGDSPYGDELVLNPPQLSNLVQRVQGKGTTNITNIKVQADAVIGQEGVERGINKAYRSGDARRSRGRVGGGNG
ncbi:MAG: hypothetical protein PHE17_19225 [Thiothrix sp.]|uniref:hypothetical protein n=1 Tax=Thiothrix sp. TaxID=1032 RepID=UPI00260D0563|nr:hypothetical protein [Thiothrix sp.]MDD5395159.1 hypothetical protein [Thiothrix sp.]